jgi:hypothetical protein
VKLELSRSGEGILLAITEVVDIPDSIFNVFWLMPTCTAIHSRRRFFTENIKSINFHPFRRNNHAEFLHHIERLPEYITSRFQSDSHECMGRRMHVLHLCFAAGICLCQLCGKETAIAQCCLSTRRESRYSGWLTIIFIRDNILMRTFYLL